jgi:hypothetical protein
MTDDRATETKLLSAEDLESWRQLCRDGLGSAGKLTLAAGIVHLLAHIAALESAPEPEAKPADSYYVFRTEGSYDQAMWWRPGRCGYTFNLKDAGIYSGEDAAGIEANSRGEDFGVPVSAIGALPVMSMVDGGVIKRWRRNLLARLPETKQCEPPCPEHLCTALWKIGACFASTKSG